MHSSMFAHSVPSEPENPELHAHVKLPSVLAQAAFASQLLSAPAAHSSASSHAGPLPLNPAVHTHTALSHTVLPLHAGTQSLVISSHVLASSFRANPALHEQVKLPSASSHTPLAASQLSDAPHSITSVHVTPSSVVSNPALQMQSKLPSVFTHAAFGLHPCVFLLQRSSSHLAPRAPALQSAYPVLHAHSKLGTYARRARALDASRVPARHCRGEGPRPPFPSSSSSPAPACPSLASVLVHSAFASQL
mmetsp:Transcript_55041/g.129824  ORF Transcript_55041/g.129824 Transcript_55041/m.129824 type:complete len:249 (+) Transcript_55041:948-1694(+)